MSSIVLDQLGWNSSLQDSFSPWENKGHPARVIAMQRENYTVVCEQGVVNAKVSGRFIHEAKFKRDYPAVGDWVVLDKKAQLPLIKAVLPRISGFARKMPIKGGRKIKDGMIDGGSTEEQIIAANIDTVFIVTGLDQDFELRRIERYLTLALNSCAQPVLVLNKADLHPEPESFIAQVASIAPGVPVLAVSAETGANIKSLADYIVPGKTLAFIGSSGVGKSTITNRLLGEIRQRTNDVSGATGKGKHTTTSAQLMFHSSGCMVIDTPGLRELQLWCDEDAVEQTFQDIVGLIGQCRFNNCSHTQEPGCRILAALENGELCPDRWKSYSKQAKELRRLNTKKRQLEAKANRRLR